VQSGGGEGNGGATTIKEVLNRGIIQPGVTKINKEGVHTRKKSCLEATEVQEQRIENS